MANRFGFLHVSAFFRVHRGERREIKRSLLNKWPLSNTSVSLAGVLSKIITTDVATIVFWRSLFSTIFIFVYLKIRVEPDRLLRSARMGWPGVLIAMISALATVFFVMAFKNTTVANAALIFSVLPLLTAFIGWYWIGERPGHAAIGYSTASIIGMGVIVFGSLGTTNVLGDSFAVGMTVCMALIMVMYRKYPMVRIAPVALLSSVLLVLAMAPFSRFIDVPKDDMILLLFFGLSFSAAFVLFEGAKLLPVSSTALLGILETPLAIAWASLLIGELPNSTTFIGGSVILLCVVASALTSKPGSQS